jgi:polyketide synthase PksN
MEKTGQYRSPGAYAHELANRISYFMNFRGPSLTVETACSSSFTALHLARNAILQGECELALAGGVNLSVHRSKYLMLSGMNILSADGVERTFDEGANGYVPGEGVGAVLLKPLSLALRDHDQIYGVIKSSAINHSGSGSGQYVPNPKAIGEVFEKNLRESKVSPEQIRYIESHGSGTALGDPLELQALHRVFERYTSKKQFCALGSKANIGHLEAASGICSLTKILLSFRSQTLAPCAHFQKSNPAFPLENSAFYIPTEAQVWKNSGSPRIAALNSFGIGGSNGFMILEEFVENREKNKNSSSPLSPELFIFSAKNQERLQVLLSRFISFFQASSSSDWESLAYTLRVGRKAMEERVAIVAFSQEDLLKKLQTVLQALQKGETSFFKEDIFYCALKKLPALTFKLEPGKAAQDFIAQLWQEKQLRSLAHLWITGSEMDWNSLAVLPHLRRVSLPGYPFERQHCWIDRESIDPQAKPVLLSAPSAPVSSVPVSVSPLSLLSLSSSLQDLHYARLSWYSEALSEAPAGALKTLAVKTFLVCTDRFCWVKALREQEAHFRWIQVCRGVAYQKKGNHAYEIRENFPEDFQRLLQELRAEFSLSGFYIYGILKKARE